MALYTAFWETGVSEHKRKTSLNTTTLEKKYLMRANINTFNESRNKNSITPNEKNSNGKQYVNLSNIIRSNDIF